MTASRRNEKLLLASAVLLLTASSCTVSWKTASSTTTSAPSVSTAPNSGSSTTSGSASLVCPPGAGTGSPGVSAHSIDVAAISTLSGPIAADFGPMVPGMKAYFDQVNAQGGVNGRSIDLAQNLDDGGNPSQFTSLAHAVVDVDHAFAVGVSSFFFDPSYFVQNCVPTYGYDVTGNWASAPNLFAAGGSTQVYSTLTPAIAFMIKQNRAKSIALLAYGVSASSAACQAVATGLSQAGYDVSYTDFGLPPINADLSPDVQRIQAAGSDFLLSCMDVDGNIALARDMKQYGLQHVTQVWLNGDDQNVLDQYSDLMKGVYFFIGHVPFLSDEAFPGAYPGLASYLEAMRKYEPDYINNELAVEGWMSASLLVAGIKAAGSDLTQANLVKVTNQIRDFTADGLTTPVDWTTGHNEPADFTCGAVVQVQGKKFWPVFTQGKQVFTCLAEDVRNPHRVPAPPGTPGA